MTSNNFPTSGNNIRDFQGNASPLNSTQNQVNNVPVDPPISSQNDFQKQSQNGFTPSSATSPTNVEQNFGQDIKPNETPASPGIPSVPPVASVIPKKSPNLLKFAFLFFIIVLLSLGAYLGYKEFISRKSSTSESNSVTPTPVSDQTSENINGPEPEESSNVNQKSNVEQVDFSKCSPGDGYSRAAATGSTYLSVVDVDTTTDKCEVNILNEITNGYNKYTCYIPRSTGKVSFSISESGSDFTEIMEYCEEVATNVLNQ